jgi:hypothetical protein
MSTAREQFCFNCGKELGVYARWSGDEPECCGESECLRALTEAMIALQEERHERAREDDYGRYA